MVRLAHAQHTSPYLISFTNFGQPPHVGAKEILGTAFVRLGLAWTKKLLRSSEKPGDLWGIYDYGALTIKCADFESMLHKNHAHGAYYAILNLCGPVIARRLVDNGALAEPTPAPHNALQPASSRKRHRNDSDDEADGYMRAPPVGSRRSRLLDDVIVLD